MLKTLCLATALLVCTVFPALADDPSQVISYTRMYVDADGESHFDDGQLELQFKDYAPPAEPIAVHTWADARGATLLRMEGNSFEDWHPAPRRQFAFILQGTVEVTVTDGEVRRFEPGDVVLLEDTRGRGHTTRIVGDTPHLGLMVPVAAD